MIKSRLTAVLVVAAVLTTMTIAVAVPTPTFASTGMSNCTEDPTSEDCNPQPDRVGNDHDEDDEVTRDGPDEKNDANCWGKVTSDFTTTKDGDGGGSMSHASDPAPDPGDEDASPNEIDRDTPREGVGNQDEDHPSDHGDTVGPRFGSDEECTEQ